MIWRYLGETWHIDDSRAGDRATLARFYARGFLEGARRALTWQGGRAAAHRDLEHAAIRRMMWAWTVTPRPTGRGVDAHSFSIPMALERGCWRGLKCAGRALDAARRRGLPADAFNERVLGPWLRVIAQWVQRPIGPAALRHKPPRPAWVRAVERTPLGVVAGVREEA